jgi:hypothetical protein
MLFPTEAVALGLNLTALRVSEGSFHMASNIAGNFDGVSAQIARARKPDAPDLCERIAAMPRRQSLNNPSLGCRRLSHLP